MEQARTERVPSLLELLSHRLRGHSVVDPDRYRDPAYLERIRAEDPVARFAQRLTATGILDDAALARLEHEVEREVQEAVEFAEQSPEPDPTRLFDFSYATPVLNQPAFFPGQQPWTPSAGLSNPRQTPDRATGGAHRPG